MQTSKCFLLYAVVVAIGVVFAATEVKAQLPDTPNDITSPTSLPTECTASLPTDGQFTVKFTGRSPGADVPDGDRGTTVWQYRVTATHADLLRRIIEGVVVVPVPVMPNDIISPRPISPTPQGFCEEDPATGINRGNCAGFRVHIRPKRSGDSVLLEITTADNIIPGVVTLNIVTADIVRESLRSDVCTAP